LAVDHARRTIKATQAIAFLKSSGAEVRRSDSGFEVDLTNQLFGERTIASVCDLRPLSSLTLAHCTNEDLSWIAPLTEIRHLDLSLSRVDDDALLAVAKLRNIESLDVEWTNVTEKSLSTIARIPRLRELGCSLWLNDSGLRSVSQFSKLERARLRVGSATKRGMTYLAQAPSLVKLTLEFESFDPELLFALVGSKSLKVIYIRGHNLSPTEQILVKARLPEIAIVSHD
jgi:hypothetical protein